MSEPMAKILQIIPADGWEAMFEDEDSVPVVCFALVQAIDEQGAMSTDVRPMASLGEAIEFCDDYPNYQGVSRIDADSLDDEDDEDDE